MRQHDDSRSNVCRRFLGRTYKSTRVKSQGDQLKHVSWVCEHLGPPSCSAIGVPGVPHLVGAALIAPHRHCKGGNATNIAKLIRLQSAQHMCACMCSCWTQQHTNVECMQGYILLRSSPRHAILFCGHHRTKAIKTSLFGGRAPTKGRGVKQDSKTK